MTPAITTAAAAADPLAAVDALHAAAAAPAADGDWGVAALFEAVANDPVVGAQVRERSVCVCGRGVVFSPPPAARPRDQMPPPHPPSRP
jgi:hypothetical protein